MKKIFAIVCLAVATSIATADCHIQRVVHHNHHVAAVQNVVAATFVPIVVPAYSVTYAADPSIGFQQELIRLRQEIQSLRGAQPAPVPTVPGNNQQQPPTQTSPAQPTDINTEAFKIFQNRCASCHDKGVAASKGGGLAILEGNAFASLNFQQALKIGSRVYDQSMPPGKEKATDQEVSTIMKFLGQLK